MLAFKSLTDFQIAQTSGRLSFCLVSCFRKAFSNRSSFEVFLIEGLTVIQMMLSDEAESDDDLRLKSKVRLSLTS